MQEGDSMQIIHKMEETHFSPSETTIIDYILEQGENIKNMSIHAIAEATYTSPPLLIRIAKKLGFKGWNEFKEAYIQELEYMYQTADIDASIPFVVSDNFINISNNIAQLEIESIQDTMSLLKHDDLYGAMHYLRNAPVIDMYAVSNNVILAQQFADKMFLIQKKVNLCRLSENAKLQASMSNENHVAIIISYSGETKFILEVAHILKQKQTPIIAITSIADNHLSSLSNVVLRISSKEMLNTKIGDFATSQSVKLILDILYSCIFSLDYQNNLDNKIALAKSVDDRHSGFAYIDED